MGADKLFDTADFVADMRRLGVTLHVAQHTRGRRSAFDERTTRQAGYAVSLRIRKRIEEVSGWIKTVGGLCKTRHRGDAHAGWRFTLPAAAYNLVRLAKLLRADGRTASGVRKPYTRASTMLKRAVLRRSGWPTLIVGLNNSEFSAAC